MDSLQSGTDRTGIGRGFDAPSAGGGDEAESRWSLRRTPSWRIRPCDWSLRLYGTKNLGAMGHGGAVTTSDA